MKSETKRTSGRVILRALLQWVVIFAALVLLATIGIYFGTRVGAK